MENKPKDISPEIRKLYENLYKRPGMYIGYPGVAGGGSNLTLFNTFIDGMAYCCFIENNCAKKYVFIPEGFNEFVADYYKTNLNAHNYYSLIVLKESGETEAFDKFWELLNKYLLSLDYEPIKCEKIKKDYKHDDGIQRIYWVDINELSGSYIRTFSDWNKKTAFDRLKNMYSTPGFSGNALWKNGKCIGAVMGKYEQYPDGKYFQISDFWIEPEYQHKGYAKKLLIDLIESLKYCECKKIYVVNLNNDNAEGFFRHFKFKLHKGLYTLTI